MTAALFVATSVSAQTLQVKGTVLDAQGAPLPGASVIVPGTANGVSTDVNGTFTISVSPNSDLEVSFIGYIPQTIQIGKNPPPSLKITLAEDSQSIGEVVVTALGISREKKTLGYAIQEVKGESLVEAREINIANALTGKIAGVEIIRSSNGPGGSSKIQLRGNNSLTGLNQPLIVVDGIPMDNFTGAANNDFWNPSADMGNGLQDINPEDVESMSVLKGASAAALYGSRAGNGVILITTKKGRETPGLGITVSGTATMTTRFMRPDHQTIFGQGSNGIYNKESGSSWGPRIEGQEYERWDGETGRMHYYDNLENYLDTGVNLQGNITFSQQYGKTSIYSSLTRLNDDSMTPGAELRRTNLMLRGTTIFGKNDRWSFDAKVQYIRARANNRPISGSNGTNVSMGMYTMPISVDIREFEDAVDADGNMFWYSEGGNNPYWLARYNQNEDTRDRFLMNASLKYRFTDWLDLELRAGTDMYFTETESKTYGGNANLASGRGSYSLGESRFYENNYSFLFSAKKDNIFGEWGGALTFGGNMMERKSRGISSSINPLNIPDLFDLNNGISKPSVNESFSHRKMNSLYGTAQINYGGFVFFDATFRNDWTSTLSKANRSFFYPSVSLSWVISDMVNKYGKMPDWFTYAKVRASYAQVGNDMDPYQLYNTYSVGTDPNGNPTASSGDTLFNADVKNELIKSWEAGLEVKFFDNRLGLDVAYYKSNATNQLINLPMNSLSGYNSKKVNAGNIQNEGIEAMINARPVQTRNFSWSTNFNIAHNKNTIIELADGVSQYQLGGYDNLQVFAEVGGDYGEIYGTKYQRVEDKESPYYGQLLLDASGLPQGTSSKYRLGSQQTKVTLGWTNQFQWKDLSFSFQVDARIGGKIFSGTQQMMQLSGTAAKTVKDGKRENFVLKGVVNDNGNLVENTKEITVQDYWSAITSRSGNLGISEANLYDATNVRLRNIAIAYSLPKRLLARTKIFQSIKVGFSVTNVCMIYSAMDGVDPESIFATSTNATGFEYGALPTSRSYVFNISLGF
ncbi:SusC/RagA family TonB-linked outer membrane protein [Alistipes sp.]|uniref:SusC/RagA family TonB-linked outer membrane protein n=1 Tax=Alistipes sp. TaxID=1872444 RepID=UPI0025BC42E8|nr:SusC/RagA family TonB-linked outer membrane protein [Alistipes sp.]